MTAAFHPRADPAAPNAEGANLLAREGWPKERRIREDRQPDPGPHYHCKRCR